MPAHCIHDIGFPRVYARDCHFVLGVRRLSTNQTESSTILKVDKFIPHPDYDAYSKEKVGNIALVLLKNYLYETNALPICLDDSNPVDNKSGLITGWTETKVLSDFKIEEIPVNVLEHEGDQISIEMSSSGGTKCIGKNPNFQEII